MALASSSAARFSDAASDDPLAGLEPANDAYGSLAGLASRPKPKKKPVLVLDADELAEAHALFQLGAAEQLEDADQIERRPVALGLAPIGSDMAPDNTPDDDEDEYVIEADPPAPDDVLKLTRAEPATRDAPVKSFKKSMVVLPPDGDPALDAIEPFVPLAPTDEEEFPSPDDAAAEPVADAVMPEQDAEHGKEQGPKPKMVEEPATKLLPEAAEETSPALDLSFEQERASPGDGPLPDLTPQLQSRPEPVLEPETPAPQDDDNSVTRIDDDEVDGLAFMRGPERRKITIADVPPTSQNSLRARLVREEDMAIKDKSPSAWARFSAWLADIWRRFLG